MHRILLLAALALLASCETLGKAGSPVTFHASIQTPDGVPIVDMVTDLDRIVILGEVKGFVEARVTATGLPLYTRPFTQEGDYVFIDDGESHHYAFGEPPVIPASMKPAFPQWLLDLYPLLRFRDE